MLNEHNNSPGLKWITILGLCGFLAGFIGPIILNPEANQGPLVGILITGPLGFIFGLTFYLLSRLFKVSGVRQWQALKILVSVSVFVLTTLFFVLPEPSHYGVLYKYEVKKCEAPILSQKKIIDYWTDRVSKVTWATPQPNWESEMIKALQSDSGVILDAQILEKNDILQKRKPWNKGHLLGSGWLAVGEDKTFYIQAKMGNCAQFPQGQQGMFFDEQNSFVPYQDPHNWPPREILSFIPFSQPQPVPEQLSSF